MNEYSLGEVRIDYRINWLESFACIRANFSPNRVCNFDDFFVKLKGCAQNIVNQKFGLSSCPDESGFSILIQPSEVQRFITLLEEKFAE